MSSLKRSVSRLVAAGLLRKQEELRPDRFELVPGGRMNRFGVALA